MSLGHAALGEAPLGDVFTSGGSSWFVTPSSGHALGAAVLAASGTNTTWSGSAQYSITGGTGTGSITAQSTSSATVGSITLNVTVRGTFILSDGTTTTTYDGSAVAPSGLSAPTAVKGNTAAVITIVAPSDNGGSAITGYTVTSSPAGGTDTNAGTTGLTHTVTGLTNGTPYTFTFTAANAVGTSVASGASNSVTPSTVPDAPTIGTASVGNASASVSFAAPVSNGGATITGYTATSSPGGITASVSQAGSGAITVTGLTNGTPYTFTVHATNLNGNSAESGSSNSVTPAAVVSILVRAPYLSSDALGAKTFQVYEILAGVLTAVGGAVTSGFTAIPNITNGWWVDVSVIPNGAYGDFAGIAVFSNINGSGKAAVELYSPPTSTPTSLVIDKIAPYLSTDTISTPGYQLYDITGNVSGSHVTAGILAISGITNGYVTKLTLTPDANHGAQYGILWDGG